jgi:hypothetical protein
MHTTKFGKTTFHHNGDYSGNVTIVEVGPEGETVNFADVPVEDLEAFVAEKYRSAIIEALEGLDFTDTSHRAMMVRIMFNTQTLLRIGR